MGVNDIEGSNFCVSHLIHDTIIQHYVLSSFNKHCFYCSREMLISKPIHFIIYGARHAGRH